MDREPQHQDQQKTPLLADSSTPNREQYRLQKRYFLRWRRHTVAPVTFKGKKSLIQKAIGKTFRITANLSNLLPTGTVLTFQLLSPIFTNQGHCSINNQSLTAGLLTTFAFTCFMSSFTDSFRDGKGKVRYGIATFRGFWVIDGSNSMCPEEASEFRLKFVDFLHAFMSALVFGAVALLDQYVMSCFYPTPEAMREILSAMPFWIGMIGSMCFVTFPTTRHGIGFPLSHR